LRTEPHGAGLPRRSQQGDDVASARRLRASPPLGLAVGYRPPGRPSAEASSYSSSGRSASRPSAMDRRVSLTTRRTRSGSPPVQVTHSATGVTWSRTKSRTQVVRSRARGISGWARAARRSGRERAYVQALPVPPWGAGHAPGPVTAGAGGFWLWERHRTKGGERRRGYSLIPAPDCNEMGSFASRR
jgi:hypothetical protein